MKQTHKGYGEDFHFEIYKSYGIYELQVHFDDGIREDYIRRPNMELIMKDLESYAGEYKIREINR